MHIKNTAVQSHMKSRRQNLACDAEKNVPMKIQGREGGIVLLFSARAVGRTRSVRPFPREYEISHYITRVHVKLQAECA